MTKAPRKKVFKVVLAFALVLLIPIAAFCIIFDPVYLLIKPDSLPISKGSSQKEEIASLRGIPLDTSNKLGDGFNVGYPGDVTVFKNDKMLFTYYNSNGCGGGRHIVQANDNVITISVQQPRTLIKRACTLSITGPYAYIVDLPQGFSEKEDIKATMIKNDGATSFDLKVINKTDREIANIPTE